ncbi:MAG: ATP-dependent nuclease [Novosphingobium sp.]
MQVLKVEARNFRTLCNFEIKFGERYCALSGKNNCGKTSVLKIIEYFLRSNDDDPFSYGSSSAIKYDRDKTKWIGIGEAVDISLSLVIFIDSDSEVFGFVKRMSEDVGDKNKIELRLRAVFQDEKQASHSCYIDGVPQDERGSAEILKKLRSTNNLILHNSTNSQRPFYYAGDGFVEIIEAHFSSEDRAVIAAAQKNLESKIRKATKQHKAGLDALLGKLQDKFEVELTAMGGDRASKFPLQIKLSDKVAEVALQEWGAGTQNRTKVFMSILDAQHTKASASIEDRSTPIFLVEEPESFLHPSAQAEFGQVLNALADEFGIQIIATTHSPYMLNQISPSCNYLLERRIFRRSPRETVLIESKGDNWMAPFAENLGLISSEFHDWKKVFASQASKVILVEGEIDKEYFELLRREYPSIYRIDQDIEIVPYEGKDALKNTALLKFIIGKFNKVFVTFDLDAERDVKPSLLKLGMAEGVDFAPIGVKRAGCECIEGLLPDALKIAVNSINVDSVNAMMSPDNNVRRGARANLKRAYLEHLRNNKYSDADLVAFRVLFSRIANSFR